METPTAAVGNQIVESSENSRGDMASSVESSSTALNRTLDNLNLNKLPNNTSHSQGYPYRPPVAAAWLVGTWKGKGRGIYPTIKDFEYLEELTFEWDERNPRPLLFYKQRTFSTKGNPAKPMHSESGFIRIIAPAGCIVCKTEWVLTAPNGVVTVEEGTIDGHTVRLKLTSTNRSSTARPPYPVDLERTYVVNPNSDPPTLHYVVDMATTATPTLTRHLEAHLIKWTDELSESEGCAS
ncbi:hypothetical protein CEUSTIGMA_g13801.t1 [Chlamydomonas eustigma]|uniref:THAP4-like heme-binding domain-containing protein n=1 Tax=Chlamydomonas eustigma TaxID=1157962 RepID=A0A250XUB0_9CHLO|nr:hypothetical protein CEUSTIGMA_g13801.t1 [Chlamydomonas eustigma]|eukprot:GAX86390.1 hypothetical protein CEUSTIGMA_g13801.t1 [Chlamydomonas eustigma]